MKISCNWLKDYINTGLSVEEISHLLTNCGLEVEAIEEFETIKGALRGIVIGQVVETRQHPNADKLTCCKVDVGGERLLDIVCGAPNVAKDQKVLVATVGTTLYKGEESFVIKSAKLRGEPSEGMICAEDEVGLGDSHAGIMVLDAAAKVGMPASNYFNVTNDTVLEIAITPNRGDAASHLGVARDLAAVIKHSENPDAAIKYQRVPVDDFKVDNHDLPVSVDVLDPEACPRYSGITVSGITIADSPEWLQNRLKAVGIRPINNLVDITNYVLMETGQPLHAFDASCITGNKVIVRKTAEGTPFVTLDQVERKLTSSDLMICNAEEPMCIAGVFGGIKSGITSQTKNIFLESAYFDSVHIRKTSKHHGLKTDASFRYERGADPDITLYALKRAALMMKEIAGGKISSEIVDVYPTKIQPKTVELSYEKVNTLIGKTIEPAVIKSILTSLEIEIRSESADTLTLAIPPFKSDVYRDVDVIEEILRIYGYNRIDFGDSVRSTLAYTPKPDTELLINKVSDYLSDNGFNEILTNSLTSSLYYEKSDAFPEEESVKILNPLSRDLSVMRQTLLFSGLEVVAYNRNRKMNNLKLYEFGTTYKLNPGKAEAADVRKRYRERRMLAIFATGRIAPESWYTDAKKVDFYYLKSQVFAIFRKLGIPYWQAKTTIADPSIFAEGETLLLNNQPVCSLGRIHASLIKQFDLKQEVFYAELDWQGLLPILNKEPIHFKEIPHYPEVRRDLALVVDKEVKFSDIEALAYRSGKDILRSVSLFDVYEGDKIDENKKSYAVSFILQDSNKTLTDPEIDKLMQKLAATFERELGALIRK